MPIGWNAESALSNLSHPVRPIERYALLIWGRRRRSEEPRAPGKLSIRYDIPSSASPSLSLSPSLSVSLFCKHQISNLRRQEVRRHPFPSLLFVSVSPVEL